MYPDLTQILDELHSLRNLITQQGILQKEVLNVKEAALYLNLSESHIYQLTHYRRIPFYKPSHKKLAFRRSELDDWLARNRINTTEESLAETQSFISRRGRPPKQRL